MLKHRSVFASVGLALIVGLVACGQPPATGSVTSVVITPASPGLEVGASVVLTATVQVSGTVATSVTWSTSQAAIASVDTAGRVTAMSAGTATITARSTVDASKFDQTTVTVTETVAGDASELWTVQFGTYAHDRGEDAATDAEGNIVVVGLTAGFLDGADPSDGSAYLRKFDAAGDVLWTQQFGADLGDRAFAVTIDQGGHIIIGGHTSGSMDGENAGGQDGFVQKRDADGDVVWTRQVGTSGSDAVVAVATDAAGNVVVAGTTTGALDGSNAGAFDAFVRKYDPDGQHLWTRQFGYQWSEENAGVAVDGAGNVILVGSTLGAGDSILNLNYDIFVQKYDANGVPLWSRELGSADADYAGGVATDLSGNIIVAGRTGSGGELTSDDDRRFDAYLSKLSPDGETLWTRQFGTNVWDSIFAVTTDAGSNIIVAGYTDGDLHGASAGEADAFVRKFSAAGGTMWVDQFGTDDTDIALGLAADGSGHVIVVGITEGDLDGENQGSADVFVRKYKP